MLSTENPPPDPSCSSQHLINSPSTHETPSLNKPTLPELDLPSPSLDHHPHHNPVPKFSIRDYVFAARTKDIKTNWPFSQQNLQLCLRHGVKEVLPPFQPLDTIRNQSLRKCTVETRILEKKITSPSFDDGHALRPDDHVASDLSDNPPFNYKLASSCTDIISCKSGGENEFPSTTTSISQSEIESEPANGPSNPTLETNTSFETSVKVEAARPHKVETATKPSSSKKCKLIVKFGVNSDRSSTEDIASNSSTVSEIMASKTCPVCRTFSSSSNTTLNAHIDQCLSMESSPKWTTDSKVTRHRIKLRKSRSMVEIYATARPCTLEELDRRNGRNWAAISNLPIENADKLDTSIEGKTQRLLTVVPEDVGDVGPVYIDADGTKVRILSKSNEVPSASKGREDLRPRKQLKGGKAGKIISTKKKKRAAKRHKYLKLASQSRKFFSHKVHASQISGVRDGFSGVDQSFKEGSPLQIQSKSSDSGTLRKWVCSKRTGHAKKAIHQDDHQSLRSKRHVEGDQSCVRDSLMRTNPAQNHVAVPENQVSSSGRKQAGSPFSGAGVSDILERSLPPVKRNANLLSKDGSSVYENHSMKAPKFARKCASSVSSQTLESNADLEIYSGDPPIATAKEAVSPHAFASKGSTLSSTRKNVPSNGRWSSAIDSGSSMIEKCAALNQSRLHFVAETDEEIVRWMDCQYALMRDDNENQYRSKMTGDVSAVRGTVLGIRQDSGATCISHREEDMVLMCSQLESESYGPDEMENTDPFVRAGDDNVNGIDGLESVGKIVDTKFHKLRGRSKTRSKTLTSIEDLKGLRCGSEMHAGPTETNVVDGENMFSVEEVGDGPTMGSGVDHGNTSPKVDPIPIPGPPGSFLPSPRDMGSDDFPGNSSLTTSRVQSSQDQLDLVDGNSSDSPISATSTISNSMTARSDLKYSEQLSSLGPHAFEEKIRSGFSSASTEPTVENAVLEPQTVSGPAEKNVSGGENYRVNKISLEKRPLSYKNGDEPCCCQRKERIPQGISLNYQESQLLMRRTTASVGSPASGRNTGGASLSARYSNMDMRPEIFSMSSCPSLGSEKVVFPVLKSPSRPIPLKLSPDSGGKFPGHNDCDSASPSASNPILRLMGKNLMVVNTDEEASASLAQTESCLPNNHLTSQLPTLCGVPSSNLSNQDCHFSHHMVPQGSIIFGQDQLHTVGQQFDVRMPNSVRTHSNSRSWQTAAQIHGAVVFPNWHLDGSFTVQPDPPCKHEVDYSYNFSSRPNRTKNRLCGVPTYNIEKVVTQDQLKNKNADSTASSIREIIVIDDVPENEADMMIDAAKHSENLKVSQLVSSGGLISTPPSYNSRHPNPFPLYQPQDPCVLGGSPMTHNNSNFHDTSSRRINTSPAVRWGCTPDGSGVLQRSPFVAAPSSTCNPRPVVYYSPRLSWSDEH